jgi:hypothetical protein
MTPTLTTPTLTTPKTTAPDRPRWRNHPTTPPTDNRLNTRTPTEHLAQQEVPTPAPHTKTQPATTPPGQHNIAAK